MKETKRIVNVMVKIGILLCMIGAIAVGIAACGGKAKN